MAKSTSNSVPLELRMTALLLLDTEQKAEKLQAQIDSLKKQGTPIPRPSPGGAIPANPQALQLQQLVAEQENLKARTLAIVDGIEEHSKEETQEGVRKLRDEWVVDMQPGQKDEDIRLRKQMRDVNRLHSPVWQSVLKTEKPHTDFQKNAFEVTGTKPEIIVEEPSEFQQTVFETTSKHASLMERARGLQEEYSYLNEHPGWDQARETLENDKPREPDIEPEEP